MMPVWTPGSYLVREYSRQVEQVTAANGKTSATLNVKKTDKNHWLVDCMGADEVALRYTLYCHEMSVRTNWVERDFAFLTGAATFLTRSDMLASPHVVHIDALPNWPKVATSLAAVDARNPWTRRAASFDELVDSPILLGAIFMVNIKHGFFSGGTDLPFSVIILLLLCFFLVEGGGKLSLDSAFRGNHATA